MKNIFLRVFLILILSAGTTNFAKSQSNIDTLTIEVKGVCGMCKERIEKAAYIKGVKKATWDNSSSILTVIYKKDKLVVDDLHQSLANAGHETDKLKATEDAYKRLPKCCSYNDGVIKH